MKLLPLTAALALAIGAPAFAQSSVSIYGRLNVTVESVSRNGGDRTGEVNNNSSRIGFKGTEDLGGGLKAGFVLNAGVNPDTGTTNTTAAGNSTQSKFFNRRSTVSLISGMGELRLGRDYVPAFWNLTIFDPFGTNGVGAFTNVITGGALSTGAGTTLVRADNSVGYFLPAGLGGIYGQAMIAAGEGGVAPTQAVNKHYGGRIGWASGPFDVAFGYAQTTVPYNATVRDEEDFKFWSLGGSWNFGIAKVTGQYGEMEYSTVKNKLYQLGLIVPMGVGEVHASYSANDGSGYLGNTSRRANTGVALGSYEPDNAAQIAIGYVHNLSKRTALYTTYSHIENDGLQRSLTNGNPAVGAAARDVKSEGFEIGVRHFF
jgi:predicted porin